jgi:ADP-ribose pyrophosphatase
MEKTLSTQRVFDGKLLKVDRFEVELDDGRKAVREIVNFPEVVVVIATRENQDILCVRQFRKPIEGFLIEAIAGKVDVGETPEEAAKRELKEETGYEAREIYKLGTVYPTPGYSTEKQHYFMTLVNGEPTKQSCDDDERIELKWMSKNDLISMICQRKETIDGKLMIAIGFVPQIIQQLDDNNWMIIKQQK